MFSSAPSEFSDVLSVKTPSPFFLAGASVLAMISTLTCAYSIIVARNGLLLGCGVVMLVISGILLGLAMGKNGDVRALLIKNMNANVTMKYQASIQFKNDRADEFLNLDQPKAYTLVYESGHSDECQMFFKESGEPVIIDA